MVREHAREDGARLEVELDDVIDQLKFLRLRFEPDTMDLKHTLEHMDDEQVCLPASMLCRIREEDELSPDSVSPLKSSEDIERLPSNSLHSFDFAPSINQAEAIAQRKTLLRRSVDFIRMCSPIIEGDDQESQAFNAVRAASVARSTPAAPIVTSKNVAANCDPVKQRVKPDVAPIKIGVVAPITGTGQAQPSTPTTPIISAHSPTRFSPSCHAVVTTDEQGLILVVNEAVCVDLLEKPREQVVGRPVFEFIAKEYREKHEQLLKQKYTDATQEKIRLLKTETESIAVSIWLKRRSGSGKNVIYQWVFEEIRETRLDLVLTPRGAIYKCSGPVHELFGVSEEKAHTMQIGDFIPSLKNVDNLQTRLSTNKFYTAQLSGSLAGLFPVLLMLRPQKQDDELHVQLISMPHIAGLITLTSENEIIQDANDAFAQYLTGFSSAELKHKTALQNILSCWPRLKEEVDRHARNGSSGLRRGSGVQSPILSAEWCRKAVADSPSAYTAKKSATRNSPGPVPDDVFQNVLIRHRDGGLIPVTVQIRLVRGSKRNIYAIWVRFDRASSQGAEKLATIITPTSTKRGIEERRTSRLPPSQQQKINEREPALEAVQRMQQISAVTKKTQPQQHAGVSIGMDDTRKLEDYEIVQKLGEGAFGHVHLVQLRSDPSSKPCVIKIIIKKKIMQNTWVDDPKLGGITSEIQIMDYLRQYPHPCIVKMTRLFQDSEHFFVEMALHGEGMDLFDYIEYNRNMSEAEIKFLFKQACQAVQHLHSHGIVHRDIKDENIIIDQHSRIQLIDFGSAAWYKPGSKFVTFCGTLDYCPPEILLGQKYDGPPQDVWALGILLYTLIYKENPFYNMDEVIDRELRVPFVMSRESLNLLRMTLTRAVDKRPTVDQILAHPWFKRQAA